MKLTEKQLYTIHLEIEKGMYGDGARITEEMWCKAMVTAFNVARALGYDVSEFEVENE